MKPFVKWAGGKRQILKRLNEFISDSIDKNSSYTYIEPFVGGGAVFFDLKAKKAIINDLNDDLINAYKVIKSDDYLKLINILENTHEVNYKKDPDDYYYDVRGWDRTPLWLTNYSDIQRAARMIFLNKTCFNGLYRVNNNGQFNTPIGRYKNPNICDKDNIIEIHNYLASPDNNIEVLSGSYEHAINRAMDGDLIYIDPPYDYEDDDGFTKYQISGFTFEDFKSLKLCCDQAIARGAFVIISNNATTKVIDLFEQDPQYVIFYDISRFATLRSINCHGGQRKTGKEVIFWGMPNNIPFPQANDMDKVIKLLMADESLIQDKQRATQIIGVTTTRQVAYYLSALLFLKYITHDKKFTNLALEIKGDVKLVKNDIYNQLTKNPLFYDVFKKYKKASTVNIDDIKIEIAKQNKEMADSTINRRASTIKSWVEWMYAYDNERLNVKLF